MTVIDIRIFFTGYVLSILLCVIVMTSLWWQNRKHSPEIALWLVDYILQFIALLFITFRGILPDLFTIVLANLFIIGGTIVLYIGLCRYVGKEGRQLHNYVMLTVFMLACLYLTYVYPDIELRTVNQSLALIYICVQGSWLMLRRVDRSIRPATRATGTVFAAFCFVSVIQITINLTIPKTNNIFVSGFFGVVAVLIYQILFIALTFALFLLVSRRLSMALESELYQRTQAENELRQSEEKFSKAFQISPYAIAITRLQDGKFIEVNDAFAAITGYSRAEVIAESSIGLKLWVNEEDRKEIVSILRRGLPVIDREFLFRRKNGEVLTGLFSTHTIQLSHEPCLLSSIDDITERKRVERDLKKSIQLLRDTGAMAKIGGWEFDVVTQEQVWTEEVYRIHEVDMNYKPTTRKGIDFYAPSSRPIIELAVQRAIEHGEPFNLELEIITAKGNFRWVHAVGKADQEHGKVLGTFQDITERKRAEEQIRRNETRLMSLLNIMQHRTRTTQEFLDYALNEVIKLTDSKIGYIYLYHEDIRQFVLNTWSKDVMKECTIANPQTCYELEKTGVWGEAVRQRKPIILNDFKTSHPLKKGYPEGHAHLTNFMTIPVFKDDQIVAVVGVANKASDYDETDVLQLTLFMDAVWKSVDIKKNEEKLRESEEKIHLLLNSVAEAIYGIDMNGNCTFCNAPCLRLLEYKRPEELLGKNMHWQIHSKHPDGTPFPVEECRIIQTFKKGDGAHVDDEFFWRSDGTSFPAEYWSYPQRQGGVVVGAVVTFLDITERKLSENYREMKNEILQILSKPGSLHDSIQSVLTALKTRTGFDAVGIRLRDGNDFPYFAQNGFSNDFLLTENTLIERDADGGVCRDKDGNVNLECTCGLVISGKTDPANPLFTKGGSAWMNDSFTLLELPPDQDPRSHPRNICMRQGYASLALVPIRTKDQIIGLMQFNDHRKNRFSLTAIEQFEGIAANIGEALLRMQAESQKEAALNALRESEGFLNTLLNSMPIPVFYKDRDGRYMGFNRAFETFFGATKDQMIGKTVFDINPPELAKVYHAKDNELLGSGVEQHYETQVKNTIGVTRDVIFNKAALTDNQGKVSGLIGAILDITERKQAEEQVKHMATHDLLTDLPSLRLAKDRFSVALNMARRYKKAVAVMFIDLDGFKTVNDTLGHDAGDYVLKQIAQRLLSCVRETDTVARVGGDEFLIIATEINTPENAVQIAEKVIQLASRPVIFNGQQAVIGTSIGIALFPEHGEDMDQLIKLADEAMYKVKNAGKNGYRFVNTAIK